MNLQIHPKTEQKAARNKPLVAFFVFSSKISIFLEIYSQMIASTDTSKWTYERMILELPKESRYEIRNFDLIDMPSSSFTH